MMIRLYKAGEGSRLIPSVDCPGWEAQGWSREPIPAQPIACPAPIPSPVPVEDEVVVAVADEEPGEEPTPEEPARRSRRK